MANKKFSELVSASGVNAGDIIPIVQSGTNKKVTKEVFLEGVFPKSVANLSLENQQADLAPTSLYTSPDDGLYRVNTYAFFTITGGAFLRIAFEWNDGFTTYSVNSANADPNTSVRIFNEPRIIRIGSGESLSLSTSDYVQGSYNLYINLEKLS